MDQATNLPTPAPHTTMSRSEVIRQKAQEMRDRGNPWNVIAKALNAEGFKTQKGTEWKPLSVYKMIERQAHRGEAKKKHVEAESLDSLRLELARLAAKSQAGSAEARLGLVQELLQ